MSDDPPVEARDQAPGDPLTDAEPEPTPEPTLEVETVLSRVRFDDHGLVTVVAQQHDTREVLMVAHADAAALRETLLTRRATYWSRSRRSRWRKGDSSGHVQHVVAAALDCDGDTVLLTVDQVGAACHEGTRTCFDGRVVLAPARVAVSPAGDPHVGVSPAGDLHVEEPHAGTADGRR